MKQTNSTRCSATTASGQPCKAWAIHGTDPPLCAPHAGLAKAQKGNQNAVKHGYYRTSIDSAETLSLFDDASDVDLDQEAILLRVYIHRLTQYMDDPELTFAQFQSAGPLLVSAIRALAYIKKQLPPPQDIDWDASLDRLGEMLDWDI
jgi:hypothetical protein